MHRCIVSNQEGLPPPLTLPELCSFQHRDRGEGDVKRQVSKEVHLTTLFADLGMHTSTPNHTAVNGGVLSMEWFKVNKHLCSAGMCDSSALLCPQPPAARFKWLRMN